MDTSSLHYRRGAQYVLLVDTVYPWATFSMLNTYDLFEKGSSSNDWWIGVVVCTDLLWSILSLLALIMSCCCSHIPRRAELLLRAWLVSMSFGVLIHLFCQLLNGSVVLFIFCLLLRFPYMYMVLLYWNDLRKLPHFLSRPGISNHATRPENVTTRK